MRYLKTYLRDRLPAVGVFLLFSLIFLTVFALYRLPMAAVLYPVGLCAVLGGVFLALDVRRARERHRRLEQLSQLSGAVMGEFPLAINQDHRDYQHIIQLLRAEQAQREGEMQRRYGDMVDYYTVWAHQIKTPIASMRLTLQSQDSPTARQQLEELQRIEQYVEMVLAFLRLDSESTDYLFREYELDTILRGAVRKFSTQFIRRRIALHYEPTGLRVLTDEKWLSFVVEQVLSNALKYTPDGGEVWLELEKPATLCIRDNGMGIAAEDLPRIFQKGYTGYNGRADKKASGLGLYLCRRICQSLGHTISAQSVAGEGTTIRIGLEREQRWLE